MRDRVTISLYTIEIDKEPGYAKGFLNQIENIERVHNGLVNAARIAGRQPPEFILSVLLIPNWDKNNNSYTNEEYLQKKSLFLEEIRSKLMHIHELVIEDFYSDCPKTQFERSYMHNLKALGSNADMIKTRAIINNSDRRRHLQIDSNTVVPSFKELYATTFNALEQKDGINASYYDTSYVSAHNKMIYTTPTGLIAKSNLETYLWEWCRDHCNDDNVDQDKSAKKNSIYARVFTKALLQVDCVKELSLTVDNKNKTVYAATLDDRVYWLTNFMVTALNMSWSADGIEIKEELKQLSSIKIGEDGLFNYQCLLNVLKKHTGDLSMHSIALGLDDTSAFGETSRDLLLRLSNSKLELNAAREFIVNSIQKSPGVTPDILGLFQETEVDNKLTKILFDCTVKELPEKARSGFPNNDTETKSENNEKVAERRPTF